MNTAAASGTVWWVTGLSGAGKTTIGALLAERLRERRPAVFLDGDVLREIYGAASGHALAERLEIARRNSRLCRALAEQGLDVVCATISLFHECHEWNRANIRNYREVYLRVPVEVLQRRDPKGLYSSAVRGERKDVMGIDLPFEEPEAPDLVIDNDGSASPEELVERCLRLETV